MKTFEEIYEELQSEHTKKLNGIWKKYKKEEKKAHKKAIIICIIMNLLIVILTHVNGVLYNKDWEIRFIYFSIILIMNLVVYGSIVIPTNNKAHKECNNMYKETVIKKLINNFYNNVEYFPNKPMPKYIYKEADYCTYDAYSSENYIEGYIKDKYSIQMAEVLIQEKQEYTDSNGEERTRMVTMFKGLFAKILMHKSINGELRIAQNRTIGSKKNKLEMDSSEFEKYFDVETSDKIKGMQILTADVMEELIAFQKNTNVEYDIFVKNNELYLRFHCGEMFEVGRMKNGPIDEDLLKKYFYMLNFIYNLSNKLVDVINDVII